MERGSDTDRVRTRRHLASRSKKSCLPVRRFDHDYEESVKERPAFLCRESSLARPRGRPLLASFFSHSCVRRVSSCFFRFANTYETRFALFDVTFANRERKRFLSGNLVERANF